MSFITSYFQGNKTSNQQVKNKSGPQSDHLDYFSKIGKYLPKGNCSQVEPLLKGLSGQSKGDNPYFSSLYIERWGKNKILNEEAIKDRIKVYDSNGGNYSFFFKEKPSKEIHKILESCGIIHKKPMRIYSLPIGSLRNPKGLLKKLPQIKDIKSKKLNETFKFKIIPGDSKESIKFAAVAMTVYGYPQDSKNYGEATWKMGCKRLYMVHGAIVATDEKGNEKIVSGLTMCMGIRGEKKASADYEWRTYNAFTVKEHQGEGFFGIVARGLVLHMDYLTKRYKANLKSHAVIFLEPPYKLHKFVTETLKFPLRRTAEVYRKTSSKIDSKKSKTDLLDGEHE